MASNLYKVVGHSSSSLENLNTFQSIFLINDYNYPLRSAVQPEAPLFWPMFALLDEIQNLAPGRTFQPFHVNL